MSAVPKIAVLPPMFNAAASNSPMFTGDINPGEEDAAESQM